MFRRVAHLIIIYSILTGFLLQLSIITTISFDQDLRDFLKIILFSACLAIALLHIRSKIGNKITYLKAATISVIIVLLSALARVLWEMFTYLYIMPANMFLGHWLYLVIYTFIPALIVAIFFRKSEKVVATKN